MVNARRIRGYELYKNQPIMEDTKRHGWIVPSQRSNKKYFVSEDFKCTCPDYETNQSTCKHGFATKFYLQIEKETPEGTETTKVGLTYPQAWKAYNEAQTNEVRLFDELLKDLVKEVEEPEKKTGRGRPRLSLREEVFCSIQKVYSQLSSRRAYSLFKNARERDHIDHIPHFNAVSNFLNREETTPLLEDLVTMTALPFKTIETDFAIDSSGFRTTGFNEYCKERHNTNKRHSWLNAHICIGVKTNIITRIKAMRQKSADSPQYEPLLRITSESGFNIGEVSADKAYSSRKNLTITNELGGQAFIPFRSGITTRPKGSPMWRKMYHYFKLNEEEFMKHYHKRSNVETTFHMIKTKLGDKLKSKNFIAQQNELLCKAIAHNIIVLIHEMFELGIDPKFLHFNSASCTFNSQKQLI